MNPAPPVPRAPSTSKAVRNAAAVTAALGVLAAPTAALATTHNVETWRGTHLLEAGGHATNVGGGTEVWDGLSLGEHPVPTTWMSVCDYQGAFWIYNPDGSYLKHNLTSFHRGCSMSGWFYSTASDGSYANHKRFTAKWVSSSAEVGGSWRTIGTLVD